MYASQSEDEGNRDTIEQHEIMEKEMEPDSSTLSPTICQIEAVHFDGKKQNIANVYMDEANFDIQNLIVCWLMLKKRKYKFLRLENQNFFFSLSLVSRKKLFIKTFLLQRIYVFHLLDG